MMLDDQKEWTVQTVVGDHTAGRSLQDFVAANLTYVGGASKVFDQIPRAPPAALV